MTSLMSIALVLSAVIFACHSAPAKGPEFHARFVHAVPGAPAVDVYAGSAAIVKSLGYTNVTGFLAGTPGKFDFTVKVAGTQTTILSLPNVVLEATGYTFVVGGTLQNISAFSVNEVVPLVYPAGKGGVRFAHFSPGAPAVSVWVNGHIDLPEVSFGQFAPQQHAVVAPVGTVQVAISVYQSQPPAFVANTSVTLPSGTGATVWAFGLVGGTGYNKLQLLARSDSE